ncbi:MAG: magnesium/cobalt transporter CorA [Candidatus Methylomirabilales bacterium]
MLRILVRNGDGRVESRGDMGPLARDLADPRRLTWVDAEGEPADVLGRLAEVFRLHPVTLEDFINKNQRPKVEEFEHYLFMVIHAVQALRDDTLDTEELHMALGDRWLLTVHDRPLEAVKRLADRLAADPRSLPDGASFLVYHLSDAVVDGYYPVLDTLGDEIDAAEDAVVEKPAPDWLERIFTIKRVLVQLRKVVSPQREVYNALSRRDHPYVEPHVAVYFRDIHDHLVRAFEAIDSYRDLVANTLDAYLATVSNRLGQVMKQLTVIATIFMPLSFLTGFFGMNFQAIPFDRGWLLALVVLATLAVPTGMFWMFVRRGWILEGRARRRGGR